ncbi:MAG: glycosyltransferase [Candidatus Thorarchaeota archaeon]
MVNILMVTHNHIPDARVEKESRSLRQAGHKVFIATPEVRNKIAEEAFDKVFTYSHTYKHNYFNRKAVLDAALIYEKIILENNVEAIHAHNIFTAYIASKIVKKLKIKFIFDDHETWSLWLKERAKKAVGIKNKLLRSYIYLRSISIEKRIAKLADHIIVTNIMCKPFFEKLKIPSNKITSLENIAFQSEINIALQSDNLVVDFFKQDKRKKIVHVYHRSKGKSTKQSRKDETIDRNFDVFVAAQEKLDDWVLVLFGEKDPDLEKRGVVFIDFMPRINYLANIAQADVGLNPLVITPKTIISSQNRIFEYAKLGVRVISTKTPLLEKNFDNMLIWMNPDEPLEKLLEILKNIDSYPSGKELQKYSEKFSWEIEAQKMIDAYREMFTK